MTVLVALAAMLVVSYYIGSKLRVEYGNTNILGVVLCLVSLLLLLLVVLFLVAQNLISK